MLTFLGIPCVMTDLSLGQYSGAGPLTVWQMAPLFQGIFFATLFANTFGYCFVFDVIVLQLYNVKWRCLSRSSALVSIEGFISKFFTYIYMYGVNLFIFYCKM